MKHLKILVILLAASVTLSSCVSSKQHKALETDYNRVLNDRNAINNRMNQLANENSTIKRQLAELQNTVKDLETMTSERNKLQKQLADLQETMERYRKDRDRETGNMSAQMKRDRDELLRKEEELSAKLRQMAQMQEEMDARNKRLMEVESILAKQEEMVNALRRKVSDALLGFEGKGLTIHTKNGKVYVSMEDKLLFKSGSYNIEPKGVEAINELSKVLAQNSDINVMIEGHTDDVVYRGSGELKDNWDLSVKRATTVVRALLNNSAINAERIIAAGRSEYVPLDNAKTSEARQKNRRIEIILSPKLDKLFEILE